MESISLIRRFLQERLAVDPERTVPEAALESLGVDSLMMLELMFEFEDRFGVTLAKDLPTPRSVGDMAALMDRLRAEQRG